MKPGEDYDPEATERLRTLLEDLHIEADLIISDWKEHMEHQREVFEYIQKHQGWIPYGFPAWHPFAGGSGDDIITVLTNRVVTYEQAESIANLWYNLGAVFQVELEEEAKTDGVAEGLLEGESKEEGQPGPPPTD